VSIDDSECSSHPEYPEIGGGSQADDDGDALNPEAGSHEAPMPGIPTDEGEFSRMKDVARRHDDESDFEPETGEDIESNGG
jgi:hypothetical protein